MIKSGLVNDYNDSICTVTAILNGPLKDLRFKGFMGMSSWSRVVAEF